MIHEQFGTNIAYKLTAGEGDIEAALKSADHVIKQKIVHQRLAPIAMERRGVLARYYPGEQELTLWTVDPDSAPLPHAARNNDWHAREQVAGDHAGSRRRLWLKAERVRGRSA